jgi:FdrA protein
VAGRAKPAFLPAQRYIRGLFCGGTLCDEALFILDKRLPDIKSNAHPDAAHRLKDARQSEGHCLVDLGDDEFTRGRPHPMIDPSQRNERLLCEAADPNVAVLLFDVVLGHGAHQDPAGALVPVLQKAQETAKARGGELAFVARVVGTEADPQRQSAQVHTLERHGVWVLPSNAAAAKAALTLIGMTPA